MVAPVLTARLEPSRLRPPARLTSWRCQRSSATYSVIFLLLALGCVAASLYIAIAVAVGAGSVWMLGWLLGPFSLFLFFGSISYGDFYYRVTGSRPQMRTLARVLDVLNRDL